MKRIKIIALFLTGFLTLASCEHSIIDDFFEIHHQIDGLKEQNELMIHRLESINSSMATIRTIVDVINAGYYVKDVQPYVSGGIQTGHIVTFTNGSSIVITDGVNADDGHTPMIGVENIDGLYYWAIDGELLRDDKGNIVPVSSSDFVTPSFSIKNGYWYISYDGGSSWKMLGKATGEDGPNGQDGVEHFISMDNSSSEAVKFVLADGTTLSIPYYVEIKIRLETDGEENAIGGRETIKIPYTLSNCTDLTYIDVSSDGFYVATVVPRDNLSGEIVITCPRAYSDGFVNVLVYDNAGVVDMKIIRFYEKKMTFTDGMEYEVPSNGGVVSIPFSTNFEYDVRVDENALSWLEVMRTKSAETINGTIEIRAERNESISRTGIVYIYPKNSDQAFAAIYITQQSTLCTIDCGSFMVSYEGGTVLCNVSSSHGVIAVIPESGCDWLKASVLNQAYDKYTVAVTIDPNPSQNSRSSVIDLMFADGSRKQAEIEIVQNGRNLDLEYAMIFTVQPNYSNDFTAYLPIDRSDGNLNCFIDWGDGNGDHITSLDNYYNHPSEERVVCHRYEGLSVGRSFEVVVTGTVRSLNASEIPSSLRSSVTEVVQWGKTGLQRLNYAFDGFSGLTTLHLDEVGAFSEVYEFYFSFANCPRLVTISEHLFDYATETAYFSYTFQNCSSLALIPDDLFKHCINAESFDHTFSNCRSLVEIPENLFADCINARAFTGTFSECFNLTSIPSKLFFHNSKVTDFNSCFFRCQNIRELPDGLFASCPDASIFYDTFSYDYGLECIPVSLLDNQRKITDCSYMFSGCSRIKDESPYTMVNGRKVHLYERKNCPEHFVTPVSHNYCFNGCYEMEDWENIPHDWIYDGNY